ncbi:MAG: GDP-L-fucose synthase 1 [Actinobacteria bacterium RBG_13_63_9]|nr:MAG: GDP-L-fucose synthase 1 [Actinobacteria bacterium RBG_13_63_9]
MDWKNRRVLVTGGASFIGSHLVNSLVHAGARVRVVDDLSAGRMENIHHLVKQRLVEFTKADLREPSVARDATAGIDVVFHLAADHGGRGYVDLHQAGPASNFFLDGVVFWEALKAGVEKVVFASSGCVYPNHLQGDVHAELYLTEDIVKQPHDADNVYGWAKLMAELTLRAYAAEYGLKTVSLRYFTVYGPRAKEDHAVMAMIARAFIGQTPFEVWGNGQQIRNWTYIDDIVRGTISAAEKIDDGTAINLGTMERIRVIDAVQEILRYTSHEAKIKFLPNMPTGPVNRVADNRLACQLLNWKPQVPFVEGVRRTIDWYFASKDRCEVETALDHLLTERK